MPHAVSKTANVFAKVPAASPSVPAIARPSIAVAVFLVCIITAFNGANLLLFLRGADRVVDSLISSPGSARQAGSFIANWKNTAGIADEARRLGLTVVRAETPDDKAANEAAESEIAENSPTSSRVWQDLAESRLKRGAAMESVLAAFHMSDLTGSHEGGAMMQRAIFGLEHWSALPEADRHVVIRSVAATIDTEYRPQDRYRAILATKSELERDEVRAALVEFGLATPAVLQALGE
jgi:hypothetical protein